MNELTSASEGGQICIDLGDVRVDCLQEHVGSGHRRVWRETAGGFFLGAD